MLAFRLAPVTFRVITGFVGIDRIPFVIQGGSITEIVIHAMAEAETQRAEDKLSHRVRFPFQAGVFTPKLSLFSHSSSPHYYRRRNYLQKNILPVALAASVIVGMGITSISPQELVYPA